MCGNKIVNKTNNFNYWHISPYSYHFLRAFSDIICDLYLFTSCVNSTSSFCTFLFAFLALSCLFYKKKNNNNKYQNMYVK